MKRNKGAIFLNRKRYAHTCTETETACRFVYGVHIDAHSTYVRRFDINTNRIVCRTPLSRCVTIVRFYLCVAIYKYDNRNIITLYKIIRHKRQNKFERERRDL